MQLDTLHARLRAEIDRRLTVARAAAAQYGPCWLITRVPPYTDPLLLAGDGGDDLLTVGTVDLHEAHQAHIALHDPADAIRRYLGELEVLRRYRELAAESESRLTHDEIVERLAQLALLRELIEESAGRLGVNVDG